MRIRDRVLGTTVVIELAGRLTVNDRPGLLRDAVVEALDKGAAVVVLDLTGVRYMDSTRLGELIAAHVAASRRGRQLKLAATPPRVVELLRIAGLDRVFDRVESAPSNLQTTT